MEFFKCYAMESKSYVPSPSSIVDMKQHLQSHALLDILYFKTF